MKYKKFMTGITLKVILAAHLFLEDVMSIQANIITKCNKNIRKIQIIPSIKFALIT